MKIRNNFDLDKLIGFEKSKYKCNSGSYIYSDKEFGIEIEIKKDKTIAVNYGDYELGTMSSVEIPEVLYNIFKMGIIEEVHE